MLCGSLVLALSFLTGSFGNSHRPPHIIFILADDFGWDDVGFHGSRKIPTPNLDALASDGIILSNHYSQPLCTPSRGSLLTGKHPIQIGLQRGVIYSAQPFGLGLKEKLLPEYLKTLGYKSHMVGKWHLGFFADEYTPMRRGFDSHYGFYGASEDYMTHIGGMGGLDFWLNGQPDRSGQGHYSTTLFTTKAEQLLAEHNQTEPMFLYFSHQAVHTSHPKEDGHRLFAPSQYTDKFPFIADVECQHMAGMISALDESVGNLTKSLHTNGMLENTIIIFSSDNGAPHENTDVCSSNYPLRGAKTSVWEGGTRVPAFVWSPLLKKSGYVSKQMMHISDWLPTLLEAAGYNMSALPGDLYGVSQWQALQENGPSARNSMLYNADHKKQGSWALRVGDMKLLQAEGATQLHSGWQQPFAINLQSQLPSNEPNNTNYVQEEQSQVASILEELGRGMRNSTTKYFVNCGFISSGVTSHSCIDTGRPCLYNVTADPCEYHNLAKDLPEVVERLEASLDDLLKMYIEPINKPADPAAYPKNHGGVWMPWIEL
ncbi:hypothetical protein CAPTEDRAFT_140387 [Capitella teleta]|uniref:Sulfatase N-terminal domain-containing protein n=1 Tax=Capitella teleta TaxID=283909 RepID=R7V2H2_CAPTE|nr:hypothetical protein CAPTEDRAFT_140387 [Capitella teleta]|eukprot:ELU12719.1 hypothetical protein CAPTEDRAFT_140387 [Capitella teleta]